MLQGFFCGGAEGQRGRGRTCHDARAGCIRQAQRPLPKPPGVEPIGKINWDSVPHQSGWTMERPTATPAKDFELNSEMLRFEKQKHAMRHSLYTLSLVFHHRRRPLVQGASNDDAPLDSKRASGRVTCNPSGPTEMSSCHRLTSCSIIGRCAGGEDAAAACMCFQVLGVGSRSELARGVRCSGVLAQSAPALAPGAFQRLGWRQVGRRKAWLKFLGGTLTAAAGCIQCLLVWDEAAKNFRAPSTAARVYKHNASLRARPSLDQASEARCGCQAVVCGQARLGHLCAVPGE